MATADRTQFPEPPAATNPTNDDGSHTKSWADYFQNISDKLNQLSKTLVGITDGSDADAGYIGEYMTSTGTVTLTNNTANAAASITLTAGDWEVWGDVVFHLTSAATTHYAVGIDGTLGSELTATIPSGSGTQRFFAGMVRRNVTASTTSQVVALCSFSAGGVTADGTIYARRMR